ncbi:glycosyltransferase [Prevotella sp. E9-3]|uniref:glycosyltransferase family 2 protein n=1 Tax=Prevotella sp. E9-3 TaxID=2913621 RepID=UPI001EDC11E3|nr:glycosyltransferase family 2 protein [Prevotella sp. E9-3]UKK47499.1 glycosyltransferase [Prevotella sp. E9-3]
MVSIIIPIYKAEKSIRRCIDSVLAQTYKDWELVLVDDGSPDISGGICDEYAQKDSRIRVFHTPNGGVSSARNKGLDEANGDRICFVDADDCLESNFLSKMLVFSHDLVVCGFRSLQGLQITPDDIDVSGETMGVYIPKFFNSYSAPAPWAKLFKKEIIDKFHIRFNQKLKLTEDTIFNLEYLSYCTSLRQIPNQLYVYDGIWGGGGKYVLSWEEVEYMCDVMFASIHKLEEVFKCQIDTTNIAVGRIRAVPDLLENHTFEDCYQLFRRYHPLYSFEDYLSILASNPAATYLDYYYKQCSIGKGWEAIKILKKFSTVDSSKLDCLDNRTLTFYRFIESNQLFLAYLYARAIYIVRKLKHKLS